MVLCYSGFLFSSFAPVAEAQTSRRTSPKSASQNKGLAVQKTLAKRVSVSWSGAPVRETLVRFAKNQRLALFVDRRVDPSVPIEFDAADLTVGKVLYDAVDSVNCGICWLGDVAYVAPKGHAAKLLIAREHLQRQIERLPSSEKRKLLRQSAFRWPRLSRPNDLLTERLNDSTIKVAELKLPHDLWPAVDLPSVRYIDQLLILAYGFGQWPNRDTNGQWNWNPFEPPFSGTLQLRLDKQISVEALPEVKDPALKISVRRNLISLSGPPLELYEAVRSIESATWESKTPKRSADSTSVFTLKSKLQLGSVLTTAAKKLQLELQYAPELRAELLKRIDLNVTRVTAEELIQAALDGTELGYRIESGKLIIERK